MMPVQQAMRNIMVTRIRQAGLGDALDVAAIIDIGGHGIDLERWLQRRDGDHSVISAARQLVLDDSNVTYHFSKAHLIEVDGIVAGGLVGGLTGDMPDLAGPSSTYSEPLLALESRVPGYWSVVAIALRGRGLASKLMNHAVQLARQAGARGLSIVVEDSNSAAIAIYKKNGFVEAETLPWIAYDGRVGPRNWVMLTRQL
jgi:GNAT superfamily N-acetyltransferase